MKRYVNHNKISSADCKANKQDIMTFLNQIKFAYPGFSEPVASTSIITVRSVLDQTQQFKFDLTESHEDLEDQRDEFILWAEEFAYEDK